MRECLSTPGAWYTAHGAPTRQTDVLQPRLPRVSSLQRRAGWSSLTGRKQTAPSRSVSDRPLPSRTLFSSCLANLPTPVPSGKSHQIPPAAHALAVSTTTAISRNTRLHPRNSHSTVSTIPSVPFPLPPLCSHRPDHARATDLMGPGSGSHRGSAFPERVGGVGPPRRGVCTRV